MLNLVVCHEQWDEQKPKITKKYRGLAMSVVGIQAYKSALDGGNRFEVPDFRSEEARKQYQNDNWSPFPEDMDPGQLYPSIAGDIQPSEEARAYVQKVWDEIGYHGE